MLSQVSSTITTDKISEARSKELSEGKKFDTKTTKHNKHMDLDTGVSSVK